jgi:hypothetical protein
MAYDKNKIFEQAKELIEKHKLFFVEDIVSLLPVARSTFWEYFPDKSDEMDSIKEMLDKNRVEIKSSMRSKWYKSDAPALQIALMKIISTDEEAHRLNGSRTESFNKTEISGAEEIVIKRKRDD